MNVNNSVRKRRTAPEAKILILETAAERLREQGLDGLTVKGVAAAAGMSHATLIHHFGSSDEMRRELEIHMTSKLLADVAAALQQDVPLERICADLFTALSADGHARLLAWLAVDDSLRQVQTTPAIQTLFSKIISTLGEQTADKDPATARRMVLLVATTAIGLGITGSTLPDMLGMSEDEQQQFPQWLVDTLSHTHC